MGIPHFYSASANNHKSLFAAVVPFDAAKHYPLTFPFIPFTCPEHAPQYDTES